MLLIFFSKNVTFLLLSSLMYFTNLLSVAMLLAKNQRSQAAQAMHELGNLQYHASNIRYT